MNRRTISKFSIFFILFFVGPTIVGACGADAEPTPAQPAPAAAPAPPAPTAVPIVGSGVEGGHPDFDFATMVQQGYWLSRDHFGPFVMASGMGIPFEPPMDTMQMAMQMVAQNPNDPVMVPQNMMPLQAVFSAGSPRLVNDPREHDPMDFEGLRLDPSTFDKSVTVRGQAWTMLKESQWAHIFANAHFGTPDGEFGAQQRFMGLMVSMLAQMQGRYAMENLMGEDGLYRDSDGTLDYSANWVMLHTLSDIAGLTSEQGGRDNEAEHAALGKRAGELIGYMKKGDAAGLEDSVKSAMAALEEAQHDEVVAKLEAVQRVLNTELGKDNVLARTKRHLYSRIVALRVAEFDHFENEEAFVVSVVRERMSDAEQLEVARHLLIDEEAEDPRWIIDWVADELNPREQDLLSALEVRFQTTATVQPPGQREVA